METTYAYRTSSLISFRSVVGSFKQDCRCETNQRQPIKAASQLCCWWDNMITVTKPRPQRGYWLGLACHRRHPLGRQVKLKAGKMEGTSKSPSQNESEKHVSEKGENLPPRRQNKNIFLQVCLAILCTEFCERLAYYGLTGSLTIFFTKACVKCISHVRSLLPSCLLP